MVNGILPTLGLVGTVALASFARRRPGSANEGSWVYHASEPSHLPSIRRDGLQPRKPPIRGQPRAVYFAPTPDHALSWGSSQALLRFPWPSEWEDDAWGDTVFIREPDGEEWLCRTSMHTPHRVPPEQIELRVGKRWVPLVDPPPAASSSLLADHRRAHLAKVGSAARATSARVEALRDALETWANVEWRQDVEPEVVYHGTNGAKWAKTRGTPALHLSVDPHEAMEYACLSAMSQLDSGAPADPRVYRVNVYDLADSDLGPDRGSVDRYREDMSVLTPRQKRWFLGTQAWRATAEETGFFVVRYPRRDLLDRFEEVPRAGKKLLAEPRFAWPSIPEKA